MNQFVDQNARFQTASMNSETNGQQYYQYQPKASFSTQLSNTFEVIDFRRPTNASPIQNDSTYFESTDITPLPLNVTQNSQASSFIMSDHEPMILEEFVVKLNREKSNKCLYGIEPERSGQNEMIHAHLPEFAMPYCDQAVTVKNEMKGALRVSFPLMTPRSAVASSLGTPSLVEDVTYAAKPFKALSAYNFFFRYERERILSGNNADDLYSTETQKVLLNSHWYRDRSKKRRHRKSHGKIDFATLSRMVSQRWRNLPEDRKNFFKDIACKDMLRYRQEQKQFEYCGLFHTENDLYSSFVPIPFVSSSFNG
jgi:hypothetical protein